VCRVDFRYVDPLDRASAISNLDVLTLETVSVSQKNNPLATARFPAITTIDRGIFECTRKIRIKHPDSGLVREETSSSWLAWHGELYQEHFVGTVEAVCILISMLVYLLVRNNADLRYATAPGRIYPQGSSSLHWAPDMMIISVSEGTTVSART
jgi:hypothetical protein